MKTLILIAILLPSCASRTLEIIELPSGKNYHSNALFVDMRYQEQWKPTDDYPAP